MDTRPHSKRGPGPSSQSESRVPKTPVKKARFADIPEKDTPRSVLATPGSCVSACSNLSSLAATPLSEKMAKMADRCIVLLDEYFAGQPPEPLSPSPYSEDGKDSDNLSVDSNSTLRADHHLAEEFHQYLELPNEVQDRILEEVIVDAAAHSLDARPVGTKPPALAVAAVSKKTREQVFRIMKRGGEHTVGGLDNGGVSRGEEADLESFDE